MRKIGKTLSGNVLIEMSSNEWREVIEQDGIPKDLSAAVVEYRMKNGLTQTQLAQKIGISRTRVQARNMRLRTYERVLSAIA
jgi:ribosome-binding protein aMBF1 (putative translation factor)